MDELLLLMKPFYFYKAVAPKLNIPTILILAKDSLNRVNPYSF
jgi:hypothetical protein